MTKDQKIMTKNNMSLEEKKSGIRIECKSCTESQIYTMRNKTIPKRPKTQCISCGKWIYIDKEILVKEFGQKDLVKKDQKKETPGIIAQEKEVKKHKEQEIESSKNLTKTDDQRTEINDQKIIRSVANIHTPDRNKERLYDVYFKTDTIENLAKKYGIPTDYLNKLKIKLEKLKYPPRIEGNKLVCYQCGMESKKRLVFHHNHKTNEYIALVCDSCNQKLENNESVIYPLEIPPKSNLRDQEVINYLNGMRQEIADFGRVIPLDEKQRIVNWVLQNKADLIDSLSTSLSAYRKEKYQKIIRQKKRWHEQMKFLEDLL